MEEFKIETVSHELFQVAIQSLPLLPIYAEITMLADGIMPPNPWDDLGENERYIFECGEKEIMPFSKIEFAYRKDCYSGTEAAIFIGNPMISGVSSRSHQPTQIQAAIIQKTMAGGRFHKVKISIGKPDHYTQISKGFDKFRNESLDMFLQNGYQFHQGDIWLTTGFRCLGIYEDEYFKTGGLVFGCGSGLTLELNDKIPEEEKIVEWFKNLREISGQY